MEDLGRLLTLMNYVNSHEDSVDLDTLYDVVVNKEPFKNYDHDIMGAYNIAQHMLHTLFDVEFKDGMVLGKPKMSMETLFGNLMLLLERLSNYEDTRIDEWPAN